MGSQKVLLVNTNRMRPPIAPLALDYIGAALQAVGHPTRLLDLCLADDAERATTAAPNTQAFTPLSEVLNDEQATPFKRLASPRGQSRLQGAR